MVNRRSKTVDFATANSNITVEKPKGKRKKTVAKKVSAKSAKHAIGFTDFIRTQGVIGLAIGLVIGGAATVLIRSFMDNIIMPPIGFILGSAEGIKGLELVIGKTGGRQAILHYGIFLNDLINFIIIAIVIYIVFIMLGLNKLDKKKE